MFVVSCLGIFVCQPEALDGAAGGLLSIARYNNLFNDALLNQFSNTTLKEAAISFRWIRETLDHMSAAKRAARYKADKRNKEIVRSVDVVL